MHRLLTLLPLLTTACALEAAPPEVHIAVGRDFEGFEGWTEHDRGLDPVPPTHGGRSLIYVDALPAHGAEAFDVGTHIVRVEQLGEDPAGWELHAMVKRGGGYNADGALGWEFFELAFDETRRPFIVWRGEGPANGDGYRPPEGGDLLGCNHCHAAFPENDSVLSPVLDLASL